MRALSWLFVFEYLIGITVERPFRRIGVNANALIHIALTDTAPVEFEQGKGKTPAWTRYVDSKRLEITSSRF